MNTKQKLLAATIVLTTALGPGTAMAAATDMKPATEVSGAFTDLSQASDWAQVAITKAKELGLMGGDPNGQFRPTESMTRQEVAVILARLLKLPVEETVTSSYTDVIPGNWALKEIEAVRKAGLMSGDGNGMFRPDAVISREELAVLLVKASKTDASGKGAKLAVADRDAISPWAKDSVQAAIELGLMKGDGTSFNPKQTAQRQEVAVVAVNLSRAISDNLSVVTGVGDATVTIAGTEYKLGDEVKGLFSKANEAALQGAKVKFEAKDGMLNKVTYLELVQSGQAPANGAAEFSGDVVFDGGNGTVDGDMKIGADFMSLKNIAINGSLEIGAELQHDFYSDHVTVKGKTRVNGGDTNTVVFENAKLGAVEVNKANVHVEGRGATSIGEVTVSSDATITGDASLTIPKLTVAGGAGHVVVDSAVTDLQVDNADETTLSGKGAIASIHANGGPVTLNLTGKAGAVSVKDKNVKLTVGDGTNIDNLVLPDGVKASDVVQNYESAKGRIAHEGNGSTSSTPSANRGNSGEKQIRIASIDVLNGMVKVHMQSALTTAPTADDFSVMVKNGNGPMQHVTPLEVNWNAGGTTEERKMVVLTLPYVEATDADQHVSVSVRYRYGGIFNGQFTVQSAGAALDAAILHANDLLVKLPQPYEITVDNLDEMRHLIEDADAAVTEARVKGARADQFDGVDDVIAALKDQIRQLDRQLALDAANRAMAKLPSAAYAHAEWLNDPEYMADVEAAFYAVGLARQQGFEVKSMVGAEKLAQYVQLRTNLLYADSMKSSLADGVTDDMIADVMDQYMIVNDEENLSTEQTTEQIIKRFRSGITKPGQDLTKILSDIQFDLWKALFLYEANELVEKAALIPQPVTLGSKERVFDALALYADLNSIHDAYGVLFPDTDEFTLAAAIVFQGTFDLAEPSVEALFKDDSHQALAHGVHGDDVDLAETFVDVMEGNDKTTSPEVLAAKVERLRELIYQARAIIGSEPGIKPLITGNDVWVQYHSIPIDANTFGTLYIVPDDALVTNSNDLLTLAQGGQAHVFDLDVSTNVLSINELQAGKYHAYFVDRDGSRMYDEGAVTVKENSSPVPDLGIPWQDVTVGDALYLGLGSVFKEPDGDKMQYQVVSSDDSIATTSIVYNPATKLMDVKVVGQAAGTVQITVTAYDGFGGTGTVTFDVTVNGKPEDTTDPGTTGDTGTTGDSGTPTDFGTQTNSETPVSSPIQ